MTHGDAILSLLRRAGPTGMTSLELIRETLCLNLTGRISDMRKAGHNIQCTSEPGKNGKTYYRYRLIERNYGAKAQNMKLEDRLKMTEPGRQQDLLALPAKPSYGVF